MRAYLVKASNVELTLRRILDGALMADQVVDVFEAAGLDKPNIRGRVEQVRPCVLGLPLQGVTGAGWARGFLGGNRRRTGGVVKSGSGLPQPTPTVLGERRPHGAVSARVAQ